MRRIRETAIGLLLASIAATCWGADSNGKSLAVASGTKVRVAITQRTKLKVGEPIQGRLMEPIYFENQLAIPAGALLQGNVVSVHPAPHSKRLDARFHGDFTPLGEPVIDFTELSLRDGEHYPIAAEVGGGAGTTLYFRSAGEGQKSVFRRMWEGIVDKKDSTINTVKTPGKMDRLKSYFWSQMPYHPQSVQEGTQYEASFSQALNLPLRAVANEPASASQQEPLEKLVAVQGRLRTQLDSAKTKAGDPVEAVVTQPVFDERNQLLIPQGSVLRGKVLQASPAGRWGRNGLLRFSFSEISLPSGFRQKVEGVPTAIAASPGAKLQVDQEGGVSQESNHSVMAPLILGLLATSALADDESTLANTSVSSNGFAIIGRALAIGAKSHYVGGTIGMVATSRSVYTRWLAHGKDMYFGDDTEVQLQISPERAHRLTLGR
jgi:hypothetical protein